MILAAHETLSLEASGAAGDLLVPGRVQRALALGAGITAEEILGLRPVARGRVVVDLALARAMTLSTPRALPVVETGRTALLVLRRPEDPPVLSTVSLRVTWKDEGKPPSPGALATALSAATGLALGAEDLGAGFTGGRWLRVDAPGALRLLLELPAPLSLADGRTVHMTIEGEAEGGGKKKALSSAELLAEAVRRERRRLDAGLAEPLGTARRLARLGRHLLRATPRDPDVAAATALLADQGWQPPHEAVLPEGPPDFVAAALAARSPAERAELAATIVTLPDPAATPEFAARTLELLLQTDGEEERAERLMARMADHDALRDPVALGRFRVGATALAHPDDPHAWEPLLAALREAGSGVAAAAGLRLAASSLLEAADPPFGTAWLAPVLDGQWVIGAALAARRRPALRSELAAVYDLLDEADRLDDRDALSPLRSLLAGVEDADERGEPGEGTRLLEAAISRAGGRADLVHAMAARAEALLDAALSARARHLGADVPALPVQVSTLEPPSVEPPIAPVGSWSDRVAGGGDAAQDPAFLEAAGAAGRAASAWLRREGPDALLQAWRLREALDGDGKERLSTALRAAVPTDELDLAGRPTARRLARALHAVLEDGDERALLALRLRATLTDEATTDEPAEAPLTASDDPHSAANRLAAAGDLLDIDRPDAAAAIVSALLRKCDDVEAVPRLVSLCLRLLHREEPPVGLVSAAERAMLGGGELGRAMLSALSRDALAAYSLHAQLHVAATSDRRPDALRVRLLEAWLGIWCATSTPPAAAAIQALMHRDEALLPLAAARLAGRPDPVSAAREFLAAHPPLETDPARYGDELLAWILTS